MTVLLQCNGQSETKDQMISLLGEQFPITAQKLYNLMKKRYMTGGTYHAVYKQLKELSAKGVVVKEGTEYRLSEEWIKRTHAFTQTIKSNYGINDFNVPNSDGIENASMACVSYGTLQKLIDEYRKRFLAEIDPKKKNRILWLGNHAWAPLTSPTKRIDMIKSMNEKGVKYFVAVRGKCKLDRFTCNFYKKAGADGVKTGADIGGKETITIYNDIMFYIVFPDETNALMERLFEKAANFADFDYIKFNEHFVAGSMPLIMFIIKKPEIVNYWAKKIEGLFALSHAV